MSWLICDVFLSVTISDRYILEYASKFPAIRAIFAGYATYFRSMQVGYAEYANYLSEMHLISIRNATYD